MIGISIIIPVYNTEKYIQKCIKSLLDQTFTNCEFIFINDGSTDRSQIILEDFQKKDNRIVLINQKNQGVSAARNAGIAISKGKYICFLDADDYLDSDILLKLYNLACKTKVDIVVSNFIVEQDGQWIPSKSKFPINQIFEKDDIHHKICSFIIKNDSLNSCCTKLFKKELIVINNIVFPIGITNAEDAMFILKAFSKAEKVIFTDFTGYYYREVQGSASRNIIEKDYFKNALEVYSLDFKKVFDLELQIEWIDKLKSIRFIETIISLIHIYFKPNSTITFIKRYKYVKQMIYCAEVEKTILYYWLDIIYEENTYKSFILKCIKNKSMLGLVLATFYSNYRNNNFNLKKK